MDLRALQRLALVLPGVRQVKHKLFSCSPMFKKAIFQRTEQVPLLMANYFMALNVRCAQR